MKIKNDAGEEIEMFTQDDLNKRVEEVKLEQSKQFEQKEQEIKAEVDRLKSNLDKAEADLEAAISSSGGNTEQIARLRRERDEAKLKADDAVKSVNESIEKLRSEFVGSVEGELLLKLSRGDKELEKKIKFEFDNYMPGKTSKEDIGQRMEKAFQLATGSKPSPGILNGITSGAADPGSGGYYSGGNSGSKIEYNQNQVAIGSALGVTDEDRKNYEKYKSGQK